MLFTVKFILNLLSIVYTFVKPKYIESRLSQDLHRLSCHYFMVSTPKAIPFGSIFVFFALLRMICLWFPFLVN